MTKTNETFKPVGLLEISKQIKSNLKKVDDLEERLHSALDAKRDVASNYVKQLDEVYDDIDCHPDYDAKTDSIAEKEVEVKLDPITDLIQTTIKTNDAVYMSGFDTGYEKGYWKGYNAGRLHGELTINEEAVRDEQRDRDLSAYDSLVKESEQRDRELLESHGIDVDGFCDQMVKLVKDHSKDNSQAIDDERRRAGLDPDKPYWIHRG